MDAGFKQCPGFLWRGTCNNKSSDGSSDGKRGNSFLRQKSSEGDGKKCTQEHTDQNLHWKLGQ